MRGVLTAALLLVACREAPPVAVSLGHPAQGVTSSADPTLARDPDTGHLLLSWVGGTDSAGWSLWFARSADGGESWSEPEAVTQGPDEVHPHGEASPRLVAARGGRIALVWPRDIKVEGRKWPATQMRVARSLDGGRSWSLPRTINDDTTGAQVGHTFHGAAWAGDTGLVVAWLDERSGADLLGHHHETMESPAADSSHEDDSRIYTVTSPDFGASWGPNRPVWGAACPCCRVSLARAARGEVQAAWRRHFPGNVRDVVLGSLTSALDTTMSGPASEPARVHEDGWVYPGCPHTGPAVSVGEDGRTHVAWYTGQDDRKGVYLARGVEGGEFDPPIALVHGRQVTTGHAAVVALERGWSAVAWDVNDRGERRISAALVNPAGRVQPVSVPGADGGSYPQLARLEEGDIMLAWTRTLPEGSRIELARIPYRTDAGGGQAASR